VQIGFLTEWQLYAQKIEGDQWKGDKIEEGKLQKMSGTAHTHFPAPKMLTRDRRAGTPTV
jgi:hypothetical protein